MLPLKLRFCRRDVFKRKKKLIEFDGLFAPAQIVEGLRVYQREPGGKETRAQTHEPWDIKKTVHIKGDIVERSGRQGFDRLAHARAQIDRRDKVFDDLANVFMGVGNVGAPPP